MYKKLLICLTICALFIVAGCADEDKTVVSPVSLVETLSNGESFQFRSMDWFINEDDVLKHERINRDDITVSSNLNVFLYPYTIIFEEVGLTVNSMVFSFHDEPNMLVSGQYWALFDDEEKYLATVDKVISAFDEEFGSPNKKGDDELSVNLINSDGSKMWWAKDNSMLTLGKIVDYTSPHPNQIFIKVSAPRDIPESLRS